MKKTILFLAIAFTTLASSAQVDTTKLPVTVMLKVKHIKQQLHSIQHIT